MRIEVGAGGQWRLSSGQLEGRKTPQVVTVNVARRMDMTKQTTRLMGWRGGLRVRRREDSKGTPSFGLECFGECGQHFLSGKAPGRRYREEPCFGPVTSEMSVRMGDERLEKWIGGWWLGLEINFRALSNRESLHPRSWMRPPGENVYMEKGVWPLGVRERPAIAGEE